ncbi:MAG: restriction endonuclease [Candidatus Thiodiazotropha taylori]
MDWREYQKQAAALFDSIGCEVEIEKKVQGSRGIHEIDVWVSRLIYGLEHHWVVECKYWKNAVTKQHVLTLKGIVDDVGADRGILLSSSGFQSGAISMAERSNITLTSLEEMKVSIRDELERYTLSSLEKKSVLIVEDLRKLFVTESKSENGFHSGTTRPRKGVDGAQVMSVIGKLSLLEFGFKEIRIGKAEFRLRFSEDGNTISVIDDIDVFLKEASEIVAEADNVLQKEKAKLNEN